MSITSRVTAGGCRHVRALTERALLAAVLAAIVSTVGPVVPAARDVVGVDAAYAAKGGGGGGKGGGKGGPRATDPSSLAVVMVEDRDGDGSPDWGDTITFEITTTATDTPYVSLTCSQDGTIVYSAWAGFYPDYPWPGSRLMPLSSPSWQGGAADCTAVLNDGLATLGFHVGA